MTANEERGFDPISREGSEDSRRASGGLGNRRGRLIWRLLFGSVLALLAGAMVILWPIFEAAGTALGAFMIVAVLILSLTPLFLLRSTLRRTAAYRADNEVP